MTPTAGDLAAPPTLAQLQTDVLRMGHLQDRTDRILASEGAGHLVHDLPVRADGRGAALESRPWRLDPVPLIFDRDVFDWLASAVAERMERIEAVLGDLYGERILLGERVVPAEVLAASNRYRLSAIGARPRRWLTMYGVDLVRDASGRWEVVQDLTDAPPGLGYALLNRSVMSRVVPEHLAADRVAPLSAISGPVRAALAAVSGSPSPRTVLFSAGLDHPSYVDHSYLAVQLGVNLVEGADLVVRRRRLWLRSLDGLEPVDVLYRRVEDPAIDPLGVAAQGSVGIPGLLQALRAGGVALANAHGTGVIEEVGLRPHLEDALRRLSPTGTALSLGRWTGEATTPSAAGCVVSPGLLGPQPTPAAVVIRMFAVHDGIRATVLPGAIGRVLAPGDDPRIPTACVAKDVWVSGPGLSTRYVANLPQVDLGRSAPTRAADALHWMNRSAERAEAMARAARVISSRVELDPGLTRLDGGVWASVMGGLAVSAGGARMPEVDATLGGQLFLDASLRALAEATADELGAMLTEATTVREFLSTTTGRVLAHLAGLRAELNRNAATVDDLDALLADFAAIAGLWNESTVGGPAWVLGDIGRRLERAQVVLDLVGSVYGRSGSLVTSSPGVEGASIEVLLAACESLVAYRRRHRSDVEPEAALALLLRDPSNPRSLAGCLARLESHAEHAGWDSGRVLFVEAIGALELPVGDLLDTVKPLVREAGRQLVERWFSAPVNPIVMGGRP